MKVWKIWGYDFTQKIKLPMLEVEAECFDDALYKARKINPNYDSGQIKSIKLMALGSFPV